jgi:hypothetical protein
MLWTLVLTTVITGQWVENASVSVTHIPGFQNEKSCVDAGELLEYRKIKHIGRYDEETYIAATCVAMGESK